MSESGKSRSSETSLEPTKVAQERQAGVGLSRETKEGRWNQEAEVEKLDATESSNCTPNIAREGVFRSGSEFAM